MAGLFFQPRPLDDLATPALALYAKECEAAILHADLRLANLHGQVSVLADGVRGDAFWTFGGLLLAVGSIATTPIFTPAGYGALAGGGASLAGLKGFFRQDAGTPAAALGNSRYRSRGRVSSIRTGADRCGGRSAADQSATLTTSFPIAPRAAILAIASPPRSNGKTSVTLGAILPSAQSAKSRSMLARFFAGSRVA